MAEGNASELLSLAGRCHDLIVVQQSAQGLDDLGTDIAEECAVTSGVPTLIVPNATKAQSFPSELLLHGTIAVNLLPHFEARCHSWSVRNA